MKTLFITSKLRFLITLLAISWFLFQATYFSTHISPYTSPDEQHHVNVSELIFLKGVFFLEDSPESYRYGPISRYNHLFHSIMGKTLYLNYFDADILIYLRLVNVLFSLGTLLFFIATLNLLSKSIYSYTLGLILITNTLMFCFISGMLSYDNATNFLASGATYFFCCWVLKRRTLDLFFLANFLCWGCALKYTYLPFAVLVVLLVLTKAAMVYLNWNPGLPFMWIDRIKFFFIKSNKVTKKTHHEVDRAHSKPNTYKMSKDRLQDFFSCARSFRGSCALTLASLGFLYCVFLYGVNLYKYNQVIPDCDRVLTFEICKKHYHQFARDLRHKENRPPDNYMGFFEFLPHYASRMMATSVGAMGHKPGLSKSKSELAPYRSTWIIFLLLLVFKFRHFTREPAFWPLTSLAAGYFLVLAIVNYQDYTTLGFLGAGLQGRYFFPVLPAFYVIVAKVLGEKNYKEWLSILFTILVFYYFLQGGFFYFLENVPKPWLL